MSCRNTDWRSATVTGAPKGKVAAFLELVPQHRISSKTHHTLGFIHLKRRSRQSHMTWNLGRWRPTGSRGVFLGVSTLGHLSALDSTSTWRRSELHLCDRQSSQTSDTTESASMTDPAMVLPHLSVNPDSPTSILLIHGAFGDKETWKHLLHLLSPYHLLIPTLPGHREAASIYGAKHLILPRTSELLSRLVADKSRGGRVHVVGHSLGANVAIHFACHCPDQISSIFVTGTAGFISSKLTPYALWMDGIVTYGMPKRLIEYLTDIDPALRGTETFGGWRSIELCAAISKMLEVSVDDEALIPATSKQQLSERGVRILVAAATKKGVLPTNDNLPRARRVAERLGGTVVEVPTMRHAWPIQDPSLFVRVMIAWVEEAELPVEALRI